MSTFEAFLMFQWQEDSNFAATFKKPSFLLFPFMANREYPEKVFSPSPSLHGLAKHLHAGNVNYKNTSSVAPPSFAGNEVSLSLELLV